MTYKEAFEKINTLNNRGINFEYKGDEWKVRGFLISTIGEDDYSLLVDVQMKNGRNIDLVEDAQLFFDNSEPI